VKANVIVFEAAVLIASIVFYQGARRALGRSRNRAFLAGSVFFWLVIETGAVLGGLKNYYWYAQNDYYSHYPLGGYVIWLGLVPVAVVLLWYMVCASAYITSINLVPRRSVAARSAVAGAIERVSFAEDGTPVRHRMAETGTMIFECFCECGDSAWVEARTEQGGRVVVLPVGPPDKTSPLSPGIVRRPYVITKPRKKNKGNGRRAK